MSEWGCFINHLQIPKCGCFEVGISDVRASDIVRLVDDQAKGWRPWLDDDELLSVACSSLFFLPPELFCYLLPFSVLSSVFECRLFFFQIARRATLCPHFLIIFFHRDSDTKIITIYGEQGKFHSSSLFFFRCTTKIFYLFFFFFFLCLYFCLSCPFRFST